MSRPMQRIGLTFFHRKNTYYIILIVHFSGLPMIQKIRSTAAQDLIRYPYGPESRRNYVY